MNPGTDLGARTARIVRPSLLVVLLLALAVGMLGFLADPARAADPCTAPVVNKVACENTKTGSDGWDITPDTSIEGFTTDISTNLGGTVNFKIRTDSTNYRIDIYRLGWYGGLGGRLVASVAPSARLPQTQPDCLRDDSTGEVDCGNWAVSATWTIPTTAVSGVYSAVLHRNDTGGENDVIFVVRDDSSHSAMVVQTSDTTWEAYNAWGGSNLYYGDGPGGNGRSYKVSYNRPLDHGVITGQVMYAEYPMIRFLERNGYDVSYIAGVDTDRYGSLLLNHRLFVSSGHDEYWSGAQRANVTAAKDAGVNLAFFSGNEMWWRVRWEAATDGSGQSYRTLVCYKESLDGALTDPSGQWTGTWRDPRFSPAGVQPENALTGQMFKVNGAGNGDRSDSLAVPGDLAGSFLWRNTAVAKTASGQTYTFPAGTLGYEWDSQFDNGYQPAGVADLSEATVQVAEADVLQDDYGIDYQPGVATHHLTLYRDPKSHALVFAAGTVQWSWGLDDEHLNYSTPIAAANTPMRQATINLLADMGVQPSTLQSGLVAASASTDTTAPSVSITSPVAGATVTAGTSVTVRGTATDSGGVVSGVEVSVDGGATWHPAQGRSSWSYTFMPTVSGALNIQVRAVDDSANLSSPVSRTATVQPRSCPCSIWPVSATPSSTSLNNDGTPLELGTRFTSSVAGYVTGVRFYKGAGQTGANTGSLWTATGQKLATGTFTNETASGWQTLTFASPVTIQPNTSYVVSYFSPTGQYVDDNAYFSTAPYSVEPLTAPMSTTSAGNGVYLAGGTGFPTATYDASNYWVDVVFQAGQVADTTPPTATPVSPLPGSSSVPRTTSVSTSFDEAVQAGSVTVSVTAAGSSTPVTGSATYDPSTQTETFQPASQLAAGTVYTATVSGGKDAAGNTQAPVSWSFTTMATPLPAGTCPCSVWDDTAVPGVTGWVDTDPVELGMKFTASTDGTVAGVRFYKDARNTGTHTGTLWSASGQQLASATFTAESTAGWQQVLFSTPVAVTAGATYIVSYHTDAGYYSYTRGGLDAGVTKGPLTALPSAQVGGNGVYRYGGHAFPDQNGGANYWVDLVYSQIIDTTPPAIATSSPSNGATGVPTTGPITITFSEPVTADSAQITLTSGSTSARGTTAYDSQTNTASFTPSAPLAPGTTYTVTVSGATDEAGNAMSTATFTFTTAAVGACPCTVFGATAPVTASLADPDPVELGMRFSADKGGWITGVRFYKGTGNGGTHTGSLWSTDGTQLATGTFVNETATGWQQLQFAAPVAVTAGTTYVVSYHTAGGHYAADAGYFATTGIDNNPMHAPADSADAPNGVYAYGSGTTFPTKSFNSTNYWVDAVFSPTAPTDTTPPTVTGTSPGQGLTGVATTAPVEFDLDEPVTPSSAVIAVTANGQTVTGTVSAPDENTLVFTPSEALPAGADVTAVLSAVSDTAGNRLAAPYTLSFTTAPADPNQCPCTLFGPTVTPEVAAANDPDAVELGIRFTSDEAGWVTGVRFYKGAGNTGTHTGSLWSADGTRLATATFTAEGASGWQQVLFATPVAIVPGTTYVASYHTDAGHYAYTHGALSGTSIDRGPLHAAAATSIQPNGVYTYGPSTFPAAGTSTNYWVDVLFTTTAPSGGGSDSGAGTTPQTPADTTPPTVASTSPTQAATGTPLSTPIVVTFSEPVSAGSLALALTGPSGAVAGVAALDASGTTATFTPSQALAGQTPYTASVRASDLAGNAMAAPVTWTFTTADVTPPTLTATTPAAGATAVATDTPITATFSEPIGTSAVQATLKAGATSVATTLSWSADGRTLTVTPNAALAYATQYAMTLSGVQDVAGNAIATAPSWSFTTGPAPTFSLFGASDTAPTAAVASTSATEVGTRLTFGQSGWVTGIRFYKGTGATGTHVGSLWTSSGQRLAAVAFTGETATGWQTAQLSQPVAVTAGTTYVVSYTAPAGRWSQTASYFTKGKASGPITAPASTSQSGNGLTGTAGSFPSTSGNGANYWVDVVFTTVAPAGSATDTVAPVVVSGSPSGAGVSSFYPTVTALFSEPVTGVTMTLSSGGSTVWSYTNWSATTLTETLQLYLPLARRTTYTVTVTDARDEAGNALAAPFSWTFTTG